MGRLLTSMSARTLLELQPPCSESRITNSDDSRATSDAEENHPDPAATQPRLQDIIDSDQSILLGNLDCPTKRHDLPLRSEVFPQKVCRRYHMGQSSGLILHQQHDHNTVTRPEQARSRTTPAEHTSLGLNELQAKDQHCNHTSRRTEYQRAKTQTTLIKKVNRTASQLCCCGRQHATTTTDVQKDGHACNDADGGPRGKTRQEVTNWLQVMTQEGAQKIGVLMSKQRSCAKERLRVNASRV